DERVGAFAEHRGTGLDRVDADPRAPQLGGQGVGQTVERRLGRAVDAGRRAGEPEVEGRAVRQLGRGARQVDDPALASLAHRGDDRLGQVDRTVDVDLEDEVAALQ